ASRSRTYAAAAPLEVAITETIDAPIARRMSTPRNSVSAGTTIIPPPSPSSDPRNPATSEIAPTVRTKSSGVIILRLRPLRLLRGDCVQSSPQRGRRGRRSIPNISDESVPRRYDNDFRADVIKSNRLRDRVADHAAGDDIRRPVHAVVHPGERDAR